MPRATNFGDKSKTLLIDTVGVAAEIFPTCEISTGKNNDLAETEKITRFFNFPNIFYSESFTVVK